MNHRIIFLKATNVVSDDLKGMPYYLTKHTVSTESGGNKVLIYLSRPTIPDKRPVIIIVHEWWGLNDNIRSIADRYANLGYVALAPDLFGGVLPKDRVEAAKMAENVSPDVSAKILKSVLDYVTIREFANPFKIGMHGFCFGGTMPSTSFVNRKR